MWNMEEIISLPISVSKGMPIEQVQKMLGHEEINTTLTYISITDSTLKNSHRKYMG